MNAANGPKPDDPYYQPILSKNFSTPLLGYVNVDYGRRRRRDILADVGSWLQIPSVTGIMFDCVPSQRRLRHWNLRIIDKVRKMGASVVAANPGTPPAPELILKADLTCIGEYNWTTFQAWEKPPYLDQLPEDRQWLMVYDVPESEQDRAMELIAKHSVRYGWVTAGALPNPWATLPKSW